MNPSPLRRLWLLLKPDSLDIKNIYIYAFFSGLISLSLPLGIQAIVNLIQGGVVSTSWIVLVTFVTLGVALSGILQIMQLRITERLQQKIFARAAFEFAFRIPKIRTEQLYKKYAPELMNRFFDTSNVQKGLSKILVDFTSAALQVIFGLLLLSFYHPFFIIFGVILVLMIVAILQFTAKKGLATSLEESKHKYEVAYWLEEIARAATTFKLAGQSRLTLGKTDDRVNDYLNARNQHFGILLQQYGLMIVYKVIVVAGLLGIGGILVFNQEMNIGQFIAAEIIILLIISSVDKLFLSAETIYDVLTSLEKIGYVTDLEIESNEGIDAQEQMTGNGISIALNEGSYTFPDQKKATFQNLNLSIEPGEKVVIAGPNGSGKSSLLYLLAGIYSPSEGALLYDDIPFSNLELDSIRNIKGSFLDDEIIFEGTVLENIAMGRDLATFENVQWAVRNLGLKPFIDGLPNGFDTPLDPVNQGLPKSIIQKLLLARAIVIKPQALFLEQPLLHMNVTERNEIIDFLLNHENKWTLVVVSSMSYFAVKADKTLILNEGKIKHFEKFDDLNHLLNIESHVEYIQ